MTIIPVRPNVAVALLVLVCTSYYSLPFMSFPLGL